MLGLVASLEPIWQAVSCWQKDTALLAHLCLAALLLVCADVEA